MSLVALEILVAVGCALSVMVTIYCFLPGTGRFIAALRVTARREPKTLRLPQQLHALQPLQPLPTTPIPFHLLKPNKKRKWFNTQGNNKKPRLPDQAVS